MTGATWDEPTARIIIAALFDRIIRLEQRALGLDTTRVVLTYEELTAVPAVDVLIVDPNAQVTDGHLIMIRPRPSGGPYTYQGGGPTNRPAWMRPPPPPAPAPLEIEPS